MSKKTKKSTSTGKPAKAKPLSGLDAAAKVLAAADGPMNTKGMVKAILAKGYWKTSGKTPAATIYSAIIREIAKRGTAARFKKTDRGQFTFNAGAKA